MKIIHPLSVFLACVLLVFLFGCPGGPTTVKVTGVSLNETDESMVAGTSYNLVATVSPPDATDKAIEWSTSNPLIATVDGNGKVTAVGAGSASITVTTKDGGFTATCDLTVTAAVVAVSGVTLDRTSISITIGGTDTLVATVTPADATNQAVTWSSSNSGIASVDSSGVVTGVAIGGPVTITVTTTDGSFTATCAVTIGPVHVTGVSLNKSTTKITPSGTDTLVATVSPAGATDKSVSWSTDTPSVATVNSSGVVTGVAVGTAIITVTTTDGSYTATCTVTVRIAVTGVTLNKSQTVIAPSATETLVATVSPGNATDKSVTWTSSDTSVATVDSNGLVTAKALGGTYITVKTTDGGFTATCTVAVRIAVTGVTLNKSTASVAVGSTTTLVATVAPSNATIKTVSWSSDTPSVATVSSSGVVTGVTAGPATITVTATDTANGVKSATCTVTVYVAVTGVTLSGSYASIIIGNTATLTATVAPSNATDKSVSWSTSNGAIATVNAGVVTAVAAGSATITVTTTDGGKTATCSVRVYSTQVAPVMVSASQGTSTSGITIIWNAASGASSYSVYRGTSSTSTTATLIKSGATTTSWIDAPPVNGKMYYYWVSASGSSGTSTGEGVLSSTYKSGYTKMTAPTISATAAGFGLINVSWTTVQNAQWYYLYVDGDTTTPYRTYDSSQTSDALSFAYYSSHYFAVSVAGEQSGSVSALSSWTPSVSVY